VIAMLNETLADESIESVHELCVPERFGKERLGSATVNDAPCFRISINMQCRKSPNVLGFRPKDGAARYGSIPMASCRSGEIHVDAIRHAIFKQAH
jgi:hypothetical protein